MKAIALGVLALMIACGISTHAVAQPPEGPPPGGPFGPGRGGPGGFAFVADKLMLVSQKSVQEELKLTDKQLKQIEVRRQKQRAAMEDLRELEPEEMLKKFAKQTKSNDAVLSKLLTADQYKRLTEISLQQRGPRALVDQDVAKSLQLTGPQKTKIQQIEDDSRDEMRTMFAQFGGPGGPGGRGPRGPGRQGPDARPGAAPDGAGQPPGGPPDPNNGGGPRGQRGRDGPGGRPGTPEEQAAMQENFKKLEALRKNTDEKLLAVLNEKQQGKWQKLQGERFTGEIGPGNLRRGNRPDSAGPGGLPPESEPRDDAR